MNRTACAQPRKDGGACQRPAQVEPDPDGQFRCYVHSREPGVKARRDATEALNVTQGIEGKQRALKHQKREARARLLGKAPPLPERKGAHGLHPLAVPVPKPGEPDPYAWVDDEGAAEPDEVKKPETARERLGDYDLTTGEGRAAYRHSITQLMLDGLITPRDAEVYLRAAYDQHRDKGGGGKQKTVNIRFETLRSREDAKALQEAQEFAAPELGDTVQ